MRFHSSATTGLARRHLPVHVTTATQRSLNALQKLAVTAVICVASSTAALAGAVVTGFDTNTLPACDDCYSAAVPTFALNYFGTTFSKTYISNNGYLTFNHGQSTYSPSGLGSRYSGQPIIAAFFSDVDTSDTGTVTYGNGTFKGRTAFGATWTAVSSFDASTSATDTFQILLVDRSDVTSGDFDIVFNYDQIQWDYNGRTAIGYNAGKGNTVGTFAELTGSHTSGALIDGGPNSLVTNSNIGTPGRYEFDVRGGTVVAPGVPEPATWALMLVGFGITGMAARRRNPRKVAA